MNWETIQFRKLAFMLIQEHFKSPDGAFWEDIKSYTTEDISQEEYIMDLVEIQQLITGLCLRRMAHEYPSDDITIEGRITIAQIGEALLADLEKIDQKKDKG